MEMRNSVSIWGNGIFNPKLPTCILRTCFPRTYLDTCPSIRTSEQIPLLALLLHTSFTLHTPLSQDISFFHVTFSPCSAKWGQMRKQLGRSLTDSQGQPMNLGKEDLPEKITPGLKKFSQIYEVNGFILKSWVLWKVCPTGISHLLHWSLSG